jgi:ectoine hydroxylase-related dioxygenase (phytanoyl-CoA dioxygenase family)
MSDRILTQPLMSNGYRLDPYNLGWLTPTDPDLPRKQLWEQYREHGYLWLKGLLDRDEVLAFRTRFFTAFRETGLLVPDSDPADGLYAGAEAEILTHPNKLLVEAVRWAAYEAFCLAAPIIEFYEDFLEGSVYLHKRKLLRFTKPNDPRCTTPHYDLIYLRGGTNRVVTSWIPIGDIPVEMGGLVYLEKSHRWGRNKEAEFNRLSNELPHEERISAYNRHMNADSPLDKDLNVLADNAGGRWLIADYEAGDMVVHDPYMVHASTVNTDRQKRIRLSTDIRYQRVRDEIDPRWQNHWSFDDML